MPDEFDTATLWETPVSRHRPTGPTDETTGSRVASPISTVVDPAGREPHSP
ncbi:MAG: hypothetical protein J07HX64_00810 [halophilic archaeon J07HX64]|nr:MAG: hypothetical protein J07HX64_00810 [halophilic archaeon J07HX64]